MNHILYTAQANTQIRLQNIVVRTSITVIALYTQAALQSSRKLPLDIDITICEVTHAVEPTDSKYFVSTGYNATDPFTG